MLRGNTVATDALHLAALREALGDNSAGQEEGTASQCDTMAFDNSTLIVAFDEEHVTEIKLGEGQIPNPALIVLLGALRKGAWRRLKSLPLVKHQLSMEDVKMVSPIMTERCIDTFGGLVRPLTSIARTLAQPI